MKNNTLKILISILALLFILSGCEVQRTHIPDSSLNNIYVYGDTDGLSVSADYEMRITLSRKVYIARRWEVTNNGDEDNTCLYGLVNEFNDSEGSKAERGRDEYYPSEGYCKVDGKRADGYSISADDYTGAAHYVDKEIVDKVYADYVSLMKPATTITTEAFYDIENAGDKTRDIIYDIRMDITYDPTVSDLFYCLDAYKGIKENEDGTVTESFSLVSDTGYNTSDLRLSKDINFFVLVGDSEKLKCELVYEGDEDVDPYDYYSADIALKEIKAADIAEEIYGWMPLDVTLASEYFTMGNAIASVAEALSQDNPSRDLLSTVQEGYTEGFTEATVFFTEITVPAGETVTIESNAVCKGDSVNKIHILLNDENGIEISDVTFSLLSRMALVREDNLGLDRGAETDTVTLDPGRNDYYIRVVRPDESALKYR